MNHKFIFEYENWWNKDFKQVSVIPGFDIFWSEGILLFCFDWLVWEFKFGFNLEE